MVIVGFDLGKRKSQLTVCDATTGAILEEVRLSTTKAALGKFFARLPGCKVLIEASTSSEWVATCLESLGCVVIVADPRFGPMYARSDKKLKSDKRDARALAEALRLGAYRNAHRKSLESRQLRARLLARNALVRSRTRLINQVRSMCEREGSILPACDPTHLLSRLEEVAVDEWLLAVISPLLREIASLNDAIEMADAALEALVKADPVATRFDEVRGIGPVIALAVKSAIDEPTRFESGKQVASYLGLVPSENSSGEKRQLGAITKSGDPLVRTLLIQAAWNCMRATAPDSALKRWALGIAERRGKRRAAAAVARKLARILWAMWRDGTTFNEKRTNATA